MAHRRVKTLISVPRPDLPRATTRARDTPRTRAASRRSTRASTPTRSRARECASPRAATPRRDRTHPLARAPRAHGAHGRRRRVRTRHGHATSPASYEAALRAAGGTLAGRRGGPRRRGGGRVRAGPPPGHHAEADHAMGFCLFNNVAVAAAHAARAGGLRRVLVLDPDVHHGNGTQHASGSARKSSTCRATATPSIRGRARPTRSAREPGAATR